MGWFKFPHLFWSGYGEVHSDDIKTILSLLPSYTLVAQAIRDAAGIPSTDLFLPVGQSATVGPRYAYADIGYDGVTALTDNDGFTITAEAAVIAVKDSGNGTAGDPYIISNRHYDFSEGGGGICIFWADASAADYHFKFVNCLFDSYTNTSGLRLASGGTGSVEFENCTFSGVFPFGYIIGGAGGITVTYDRCKCIGASTDIFKIVTAHTTNPYTVVITDCWITDQNGAYTGLCYVLNIDAVGENVVFQHNYIKAQTAQSIDIGVRMEQACASLLITNNEFIGCGNGGAGYATIYTGVGTSGPATITYNRFTGSLNEHMHINHAATHEVAYNEFNDNGSNYRQVYYNDTATNINNVDIHHNKFTKTTGIFLGGNENCMGVNCGNVVMRENWCAASVEDPFEFVSPRAGCKIINVVADNCPGQIAVFFQQHATAPTDMFISGVYGDCGYDAAAGIGAGELVTVYDVAGGTVQTVVGYTDKATVSAVALLESAAWKCQNVTVIGPIVNTGPGGLIDDNSTGTGNFVSGVVGVDSLP